MPLWKQSRGSRVRDLVKGEEYDEIVSIVTEDKDAAFELVSLLDDSESEVRENAAESIGRIGADDLQVPEVVKIVMPRLKRLLEDSRPEVREATTRALVNIAWNWLMWEDIGEIIRPLLPWFTKLLYDNDGRIRGNASEAVKVAAEWIEDQGEDVDFALLTPVLPQLSIFLTDAESSSRGEAVWAIRAIAHRRPDMVRPMVDGIVRLLEDSKGYVRLGAAATLRYVAEAYPETVRSALPSLLVLLEVEDPNWVLVSKNATIVLGLMAGDNHEVVRLVVPKLIELLRDESELLRADAACALGKIGETNREVTKPAVPQLEKLLEDPDTKVRESAAEAIRRMKNEDF